MIINKNNSTTNISDNTAGYISTSLANESNITDGYTSTSTTTFDVLPERDEKILAKIGFKHNKKTNKWELILSATIEINSMDKILSSPNESMNSIIISNIKKLKQKLIKKLKTKTILAELLKAREIKE